MFKTADLAPWPTSPAQIAAQAADQRTLEDMERRAGVDEARQPAASIPSPPQETPPMLSTIIGLAAGSEILEEGAATIRETLGDAGKAVAADIVPQSAPAPLPTMREAAAAQRPQQEQQQELGLEL